MRPVMRLTHPVDSGAEPSAVVHSHTGALLVWIRFDDESTVYFALTKFSCRVAWHGATQDKARGARTHLLNANRATFNFAVKARVKRLIDTQQHQARRRLAATQDCLSYSATRQVMEKDHYTNEVRRQKREYVAMRRDMAIHSMVEVRLKAVFLRIYRPKSDFVKTSSKE